MMLPEDLTTQTLVALRNLLLLELREFISALDQETSGQLQQRKERIRRIDEEIDRRRPANKCASSNDDQ